MGVDAVNPGPVNFTVRKTVCGNDEFEIGEACDDGAANALDGDCSPACRLIGRDGDNERDPNDAKNAENQLIVSVPGQTEVGGRLTGGCDVDRFSFEVPEGTSLSPPSSSRSVSTAPPSRWPHSSSSISKTSSATP